VQFPRLIAPNGLFPPDARRKILPGQVEFIDRLRLASTMWIAFNVAGECRGITQDRPRQDHQTPLMWLRIPKINSFPQNLPH